MVPSKKGNEMRNPTIGPIMINPITSVHRIRKTESNGLRFEIPVSPDMCAKRLNFVPQTTGFLIRISKW